MRSLKRMLLIHWHGYSREIISFDQINFLTGKTAAGKSTIIDALQLVLLGDTGGSFFNKAANEKSVRTLRSYLFGETGDDGETGSVYLRKSAFSSYVVLEFENTERGQSFCAGLVCDCHEDLNYEHKWFVLHHDGIPADLFCDPKTQTPYDIAALRRYLKREYGKNDFEFIDTNKRFQMVMLGKYGQLKRKYLQLLKKAVPFQPISDIEQFITESICDIKNEIRIEQMQSDIRVYRNLEADAGRIQKRIEELTAIREISVRFDADKEKLMQQSYVADRAEKEEYLEEEKRLKDQILIYREKIAANREQMEVLTCKLKQTEEEITSLEQQYYGSDLKKQQDDLERRIRELDGQIKQKEKLIADALQAIRNYGQAWKAQEEKLLQSDFALTDEEQDIIHRMAEQKADTLDTFPFIEAAEVLGGLSSRIYLYVQELKLRYEQIRRDIHALEEKRDNLKKGIKPYPQNVLRLKRVIEKELFEKYKKTVEARILADLLEIRDLSWQNAIEGYLDRQKFYLLLPAQYYRDAVGIYDRLRKEENVFDAGLVDIGKLKQDQEKRNKRVTGGTSGKHDSGKNKTENVESERDADGRNIRIGTLAEEIETTDPDARLYADYLLGNVYKCEDAKNLNKYRTAITKNVMLYKNYVSRRIPPHRYENPFIGRHSMQLQLERVEAELLETEKEAQKVAAAHRHMQAAASTKVLQEYEAQQRMQDVEDAKDLPDLCDELQVQRDALDAIDFTWLTEIKARIDESKKIQEVDREAHRNLDRENTRSETKIENIEQAQMPDVIERLNEIQGRILMTYDEAWIAESGEPRYEKEKKNERTSLSLRESFRREATRTKNEMERLSTERMKLREQYNLFWKMPYDSGAEDNKEYDGELSRLDEMELPEYIEKIKEARVRAYDQFRDDFIAKMKSNIETVREQIKELNDALKNSVFGTDRYRFVVKPRAEYERYYTMITDPMLMDTGGWNLASENFNRKYQKEIDELFSLLILEDLEASAERRREYEANVRKFTDYRTYLVFDLIVTNEQGEEQRLSRTLLKKSGGETQIPFYIAMLASFSQVCRVKSKSKNDTMRLIILDEAFSKMDGERIQECIHLLRRFGLQAIFSAPTDKIADIAPLVNRNIAVYKDGHDSFTRYFSAKDVEEIEELAAED